jgi:hypothetical protein
LQLVDAPPVNPLPGETTPGSMYGQIVAGPSVHGSPSLGMSVGQPTGLVEGEVQCHVLVVPEQTSFGWVATQSQRVPSVYEQTTPAVAHLRSLWGAAGHVAVEGHGPSVSLRIHWRPLQ